ncbi:MAG: glucokinase [Xanthomonadaceae bacterium]|nr:glucokinase [Xanthomonadaceae bacterium]
MKGSSIGLAADLGGTHARFLLNAGGLRRVKLEARAHDSIESVLAAALAELKVDPRGLDVALAVAGPVRDDHAQFTNLNWQADAEALVGRFGFRRVLLLNDVEAAARAAAVGLPDGAAVVHAAPDDAASRHALVSIGTGLGVAYWHGTRVQPSEAGHAGFAPAPGWPTQLAVALGAETQRITWERVLSGSGLCAVFAQLQGAKGVDAASVTRAAAAGEPDALVAVSRFAYLLGLFVGDTVLAAPAPGGVLLAGGVIAGLSAVFDGTAFADGYLKGRQLAEIVAQAPVWRTDLDELALHGALAALART